MTTQPPFTVQRLSWLRWSCTTALGLSVWCAGAALAFDAQGHRGARGLAPENTLAGIEQALAIGVTTLEFDVVLSAEGVPVVSHDTAPNPDITRDASGKWLQSRGKPFNQLSLEQIAGLDVGRINPASRYARDFQNQAPQDGERIPTLAALFERVKRLGAGHVRFNIELKLHPRRPDESPEPEAFVRAVASVINSQGMASRTTLQSFDWRVLKASQSIAPGLPLSFLSAQLARFNTLAEGEWTSGLKLADFEDAPTMVAAAGGRLWSPHFNDLSQATLARARSLNLRVIPWTVNEPNDMARLIDWGVDGLITDYPDRLRAVMQQRGMVPPPAVASPPATAGLAPPAPRAEPVRFGVAPDLR
ncbi:glycerophosphodiester phosphodiesterase [Hydrogenophaga sp. PBL-H3]|uniref:glycerophosphodiester phosphodiesterase n=1 Tax=Hydrogenophaga sp. PBL-H3 TaxID=434010 RepID=UPI00131F9982|nr:glycerophosphodiester phosphodiesterase [Hydrogenophaga sp. PBL-H3]QHE75847.1 glycerophosphodiester phosphodiesterase [Hydrogenophaga sp. PBL-H3]QHE80272.1 glycerophosphodiester phosphodiesterase [Hydrogenophaga sp. PBL-H3]